MDDEVDTDFSYIIILFEVNEEVEADISFFYCIMYWRWMRIYQYLTIALFFLR